MDTFSHAAWGYATLNRQPRLRWWGALAGAAPDLLWFVPRIWRADGPPLPPELVESYFRYYVYTHSLVLLGVVTAMLVATRWRRYAWLAIPYALHIVMDIPTHERYQTQPFYPLSSWHFDGLTWADPRIFWPNTLALVVVYAWILFARRGADRADNRRSHGRDADHGQRRIRQTGRGSRG
jgi:hypothetical protein